MLDDIGILIAERLLREQSTDVQELHLESLHMDDSPHKFVMQDHWRGKGCHMDHRWERLLNSQILDGMTIAIMKPDVTREDVTTLAQAKEMMTHTDYFKLSDTSSELRLYAETKTPEPREWLTVEGIVEPGDVGGTRYEYGVFAIRDKGVQYFGAQKPFFKEFFIEGGRYTGRWVYRQIESQNPESGKQAWLWQYGKPLDQTPFVLGRRAVNEKWVPPWKVSCLPPSIRARVPEKYIYWEQRSEGQRIQVRDALRTTLLKHVKATKTIRHEERSQASLQHHWWKKRTIVRVGPSAEHWDLRIETSKTEPMLHFILTEDPLQTDEPIGAIDKPCGDHTWLFKGFGKPAYLAPGTVGNPTKDTPAWVEGLDRGTATIISSSATFMKIQFNMTKLKGLYTFSRTSSSSPYWRMSKSDVPKPQ